MFSTLYFPMVAAMSTPHAASNDEIADRFMKAVTDGELRLAESLASRWAEEPGTDDDAAYPVQLYGDLRLMARAEVDADEAYRRSQKVIRASKQALRVASCRNAGWQALFRNRLGTALACFARLADERGITAERAAEARFAIVCILQELGKTAQVSVALEDLREQIGDIGDIGEASRQRWQELADTLEFDLAVQADIRTAAPLQDHVFWQSSVGDGVTCASAKPANYLEDLLAKIARVRSPLLRIRIDALRQQRAASCGDRAAFTKLLDHLQWARRENVPDYQRTACIEVALVALAAAAPQLAETVLEPLHHITQTMTGHRQLEYLYCMSKTRQSQGRGQEATRLYSRYALVAMQCLRADSHLRAPIIERTAKSTPQLDDVGARLPAKYRRAYQYALDNLDRQDLSVREIAAQIGVTERALQSAFRELLGLTPTELIRQQRMERIRAELVDGAFSGERGVLDAASRWGVGNRSTLINSYRKQFDEAPSETLGR